MSVPQLTRSPYSGQQEKKFNCRGIFRYLTNQSNAIQFLRQNSPSCHTLLCAKSQDKVFCKKTDNLENEMVTAQKLSRTNSDPNPLGIAPIGAHAADAAVDQTWFD